MAALTHTGLFADDVQRFLEFYGAILGLEPVIYGDAYAELATTGATLAIYDVAEQNALAPGSAESGANRSMILEFNVADVEGEYERLTGMGVPIVKGLTTQEWGNRSFYCRDPEGNLVNFYARVGGA